MFIKELANSGRHAARIFRHAAPENTGRTPIDKAFCHPHVKQHDTQYRCRRHGHSCQNAVLGQPQRDRIGATGKKDAQRQSLAGIFKMPLLLKQPLKHIGKGVQHFKHADRKDHKRFFARILKAEHIGRAQNRHCRTGQNPQPVILAKAKLLVQIRRLERPNLAVGECGKHLTKAKRQTQNSALLHPGKPCGNNGQQHGRPGIDDASDHIPKKSAPACCIRRAVISHLLHLQSSAGTARSMSVFPPAAVSYNHPQRRCAASRADHAAC